MRNLIIKRKKINKDCRDYKFKLLYDSPNDTPNYAVQTPIRVTEGYALKQLRYEGNETPYLFFGVYLKGQLPNGESININENSFLNFPQDRERNPHLARYWKKIEKQLPAEFKNQPPKNNVSEIWHLSKLPAQFFHFWFKGYMFRYGNGYLLSHGPGRTADIFFDEKPICPPKEKYK